MAGSKKYPTLQEREPVSVKIERFTKEDVQQANREFKEGMAESMEEMDRKLSRSANSESTRNWLVKTLA